MTAGNLASTLKHATDSCATEVYIVIKKESQDNLPKLSTAFVRSSAPRIAAWAILDLLIMMDRQGRGAKGCYSVQ